MVSSHRLRKLTTQLRPFSFILILFGLILLSVTARQTHPAKAQREASPALLFPAGGGVMDILPALMRGAVDSTPKNLIRILILPITLASNPDQISDMERRQAQFTAENLQSILLSACEKAAGTAYSCQVEYAPILTRSDALDSRNLEYFNNFLSMVYIPDGSPAVAMEVIGGTLIEGALVRAHQVGSMIAGTGAGGTLQSPAMLNGYNPGYGPSNALNFDAVDVWANAEQHGLLFGIQHAIIDTDYFAGGNIGRLLNAISLPGDPHLGIGIDSGTSVDSPDGQILENIAGRSGIMLLDAQTYQSAEGVRYQGCGNTGVAVLPCTPLISLRNVLVHLLAPGNFSYDLNTRQVSSKPSQASISRTFDAFNLPPEAGALVLLGGYRDPRIELAEFMEFTQASGGSNGHVLVISTGYSNSIAAQEAGMKLASALGTTTDVLILPAGIALDPNLSANYTGIAVVGGDPAEISAEALKPIYASWRSGTPVLLSDSAALLAGKFYASQPVPPEGVPIKGNSASRDFLQGEVSISAGLGMLPIALETNLMSGNRWGRLFSLAYEHPDLLAVGLNTDTGMVFKSSGANLYGSNVAFILDLRGASLAVGDNQALVVANGLLDVFAPGDVLKAEPADAAVHPAQAETPMIITPTSSPLPTATSTATPTATPIPTRTPKPTHAPRPTATPPIIPPPSNPEINQWLAVFGALIVVVFLTGLLINRRKLR
jgi:cyanophycinase-like exopeptidase